MHQATSLNLATVWRYGSRSGAACTTEEKIGFTVDQTIPTAGGFELQEDGRLRCRSGRDQRRHAQTRRSSIRVLAAVVPVFARSGTGAVQVTDG